MKEKARSIISVSLSFALVWILVQNYRHQRETDRQVAEIQNALAHIPAPRQPTSPVPAVFLPSQNEHSNRSATLNKERDLKEILTVGWNLVDGRNKDEAAKAVLIFREGIKNVDPRSAELYNGLGRALLVAGKPTDAIAAWRQGLELAPGFAEMQSGIGWAYCWLNDPCRAQKAWREALAMNPHLVDAWSALAWIDLALGDKGEAKRGFEELVQFNVARKPWVMGLSMARGGNTDLKEISKYFPLPPLQAFSRPLPVDPAPPPETVSR